MSSRFWTFVANLLPGQTARSEQVNAKFSEIEEGLDLVAGEMNQAIRVLGDPNAPTENTYQLNFNAAQRAGRAIGFDAGGSMTLVGGTFVWKGDWTPGTFYTTNDVVRGPISANYSLFLCTGAHTSSDLFADDESWWTVMIDLTEARRSLILHTLVYGPNSSYALSPGQDVMVDVSAGSVGLILPSSPSISDQPINVMHVAGNIADNPITILRNGKKIMALSEDMVVNTSNASFGLAYCNDALGWRIRGV